MSLKNKLKNNEITIGSWITIAHPSVVEVMASAGFEWLVVDMEHTSIDLFQAQILISTIQSCGLKALVRVAKNEEVTIKKVLDMGADGIIVPMIKNLSDAKQAVDYAKYPPTGKRGVGLFRAQKYGSGFNEYKNFMKDELVIIAQIEHFEAVDNIEEIINIDGIDGVIIGPYDLSASMGLAGQYDDARVVERIDRVVKICKDRNFPSGFHIIQTDAKHIQDKISLGCKFLAYSLDFLFLGDCARDGMRKIKEELK
ncbi:MULTISPECIES: HpcH/HpaI aldolase family protein [unclassified Campylobacter]|uniref:HpcH/HpaI aldolase family protein n=1 Tax=unclassified Campylobacter TaxID=2593542 RepID=UPI003D33024B